MLPIIPDRDDAVLFYRCNKTARRYTPSAERLVFLTYNLNSGVRAAATTKPNSEQPRRRPTTMHL